MKETQKENTVAKASKKELTEEQLGVKPAPLVESDKEMEIQALIERAAKFMDDNPDITEVRVGLAGPYRKFVSTMFPGVENVANGIVASAVNSLHIQIRQPAGYPRCAALRQKLFRCDIDIVFTETDGFAVFLLPLHDKSLNKNTNTNTNTGEEGLEKEEGGLVESDAYTEDKLFGDYTDSGPKRLGISMLYDLDKPYKDQIERYQEEALNVIQQFCTLKE